jgi:serine protease Do
MLGLYAAPGLLLRWRTAEAQADGQAVFVRRQAELKAEAEDAHKKILALNDRVQLVSLGFREVVRKVSPTVVNVVLERRVPQAEADRALRRPAFYDPKTDSHFLQLGVGSGILARPGWVLTNYHVVKHDLPEKAAARLRVTFANEQWVTVALKEHVFVDPLTDLAAIRLPEEADAGLKKQYELTAEFADSDRDVQVGDWALAIGSPLGLRQTVTQGIISAKGRLIGMLDLVELLQTDAAINPGNSGGPLFDQFGRVAGINVAIASDNGGNQGIGFAIPSNTAREIFTTLVDKGEVVRGYLGVLLRDLSRSEAREFGVSDTGGVVVAHVEPGQAANRAGLQVGDIIVRYNGRAVGTSNGMRQLRQAILRTAPGLRVGVEVVRKGERQTLTVTMARRPARLM